MEVVERQKEGVPYDSEDLLFEFGFGLSTRGPLSQAEKPSYEADTTPRRWFLSVSPAFTRVLGADLRTKDVPCSGRGKWPTAIY